jgi:undecaprenyl diphosphate synthase
MDNMLEQPNVPVHLGIIPDGNRRWAQAHGLSKLEGHYKGNEVMQDTARKVFKRGVKYFTVFAFSTENWDREPTEVTYLMDLFYRAATKDVDKLHAENIRVRHIGSRDRLSAKLLKAIDAAEEKTKNNTGGTFALCLNYGGKQEIDQAVKRMQAAGGVGHLSDYLYAPEIPPLDLIVRTSGEQRISGFMLYRSDYAELKFMDKHWPEFTEADLDEVLADYAARQRRFGK